MSDTISTSLARQQSLFDALHENADRLIFDNLSRSNLVIVQKGRRLA